MPNVDSVYIDLAIGMAVAFFLLSLLPSGLNETLTLITRIRSKFLGAYLNEQFTAKATSQPAGTAARAATRAMPAEVGVGAMAAHSGKRDARQLPSSSREMWKLMRSGANEDPRPNADVRVEDDAPIVDQLHRQLLPIGAGSSLPG